MFSFAVKWYQKRLLFADEGSVYWALKKSGWGFSILASQSCFTLVTLRRWKGKSHDPLITVDMTFAMRKTLFYMRKLCHFD